MSQRYLGGVITANPTTPTMTTESGVWTLEQQFQYSNVWSPEIVGNSLRFRSSASAYLNRTLGTPTNGTIWTWSGWVKRGALGTTMGLQHGFSASNNQGGIFFSSDALSILDYPTAVNCNLTTTQVFRDPSAWYHIVVAVDTTQATASNRVKVYVNGAQVTAFSTATYPTQNTTFRMVASGNSGSIGRYYDGSSYYFDGYMAEVYFVDGQALTPSSFGAFDSNGVWQPLPYTGTFGTNGFYLNFADNSAATAATIGKDSSGNGNNWTPNNISVTSGVTYDSMLDTPTPYADGGNGRGNYAVLNPIAGQGNGTYSDGNLAYLNGVNATWKSGVASMGASSGKYYFEYTVTAVSSSNYFYLGVAGSTYKGFTSYLGATADSWGFQWNGASSVKTNNNSSTTVSTAGSISVNDVIQVAIDLGTGSIWWGRNNTWVQGDPSAGTGASFTNLTETILPAFAVYSNGGDKIAANFGQRPFAYTPPTGFKALNTQNLPVPNITNGAKYMAATLYTGTGAAQSISNAVNGVSFQPDFIWFKSRAQAYSHVLYDSVRGVTKSLISNSTAAEDTDSAGQDLTSFNSNGFSLGTVYNNSPNNSLSNPVAWQWQAGQGVNSSNTNGSIASTVSVNATAGFSVVTYTSTTGTVGHGLGVAPAMIIMKARNNTDQWTVGHKSLNGGTNPWNYGLPLNDTASLQTNSGFWNNTAPTSTVFSQGSWDSGNTKVAYCWAEVAGYSKFGSYTGNSSTDGPFIYCGFRPRWILFKNTANYDWHLFDSSRSPYNLTQAFLKPNLSNAEASNTDVSVDLLSNGFKLRGTDLAINGPSANIIFAAFAENPFNISRAR